VEKRVCQDVLDNAPRPFPAALVLFFYNIDSQPNPDRTSLLPVLAWFHDLVFLFSIDAGIVSLVIADKKRSMRG
jgi:hypothetical protein